MTVNDEMAQSADLTPGSLSAPVVRGPSGRTYLLVAVALVVIVIAASTIAQSKIPRSLVLAQHHYVHDVTNVEEADVIFNGGGPTAPDHSTASTKALIIALGIEVHELHAEKWPKVAAGNIDKLAALSGAQERVLDAMLGAPTAKQSIAIEEQSRLLGKIENTTLRILKQLKLPLPTNASAPVSLPKYVP